MKERWLYLIKFEQYRWPAGNPETGYLNCDASPTKTECLKARRNPETHKYWKLCFGKRPPEELYVIASDPDCLHNLADAPEQKSRCEEMRELMLRELNTQGDPRVRGEGHIFETYPFDNAWLSDYYERYMRRHETGECMQPAWILSSDVETIDEE